MFSAISSSVVSFGGNNHSNSATNDRDHTTNEKSNCRCYSLLSKECDNDKHNDDENKADAILLF